MGCGFKSKHYNFFFLKDCLSVVIYSRFFAGGMNPDVITAENTFTGNFGAITDGILGR